MSTLEQLSTLLGLVEFDVNSAVTQDWMDMGRAVPLFSQLTTLLLSPFHPEKYLQMSSVVLGCLWIDGGQAVCAVM